jgi:hypothetical protein
VLVTKRFVLNSATAYRAAGSAWGDQTFRETCWQRRYLLRAIAVPIASPLDQDWQSFRRTLREMWQLTTQASNWMVTELYSLDAAFARCGENAADGAALSVSGGAH